MTDTSIIQNIVAVSNKKTIEWKMSQKKIEEILKNCSKFDECRSNVKHDLENEIRKMWSDLEIYKTELDMQNDELMHTYQVAEDARKDYVELFNSSPVGYLILNGSAIVLNANQTFADMVKTDLTQIYQKPFQNFIAKEDISNFLSRFKSYFKNPSDKFFELTLNDSRHNSIIVRLEGRNKKIPGFSEKHGSEKRGSEKHGSEKHGSNELSRANQQNRTGGQNRVSDQNETQELLLISLSDITQLKLIEQEKETLKTMLLQARKMEAIGTLAAGVAHDFNNILFPILGFGEMLKDEFAIMQNQEIQTHREKQDGLTYKETKDGLTHKEEMVEMIEGIITNTLRAKDLVKQILAFSRPTTKAITPLYLNIILTEIIVSLRPTLPANIKLLDRINNTCSMVIADADEIRQAIMNLITNALESMEEIEREGTLTIELTEDYFNENCPDTGASVNGRYVCLSVTDTGDGIESQNISRIFDPYFSTRQKFKGAGLGLSVVHGIVNGHKGEIIVKSKPREGSTFKLFFPPHTVLHEKHGIFKRKLLGGNEKILVVDDQEYITKLLATMLERLGYTVVTYNNPIAALSRLKETPQYFDLVITDMTMPLMTGDRVAIEVMSICPKLPIIILTGYSEKLSPKQATDMGVKGYLMKPVSLAELAGAVRVALTPSFSDSDDNFR